MGGTLQKESASQFESPCFILVVHTQFTRNCVRWSSCLVSSLRLSVLVVSPGLLCMLRDLVCCFLLVSFSRSCGPDFLPTDRSIAWNLTARLQVVQVFRGV